MKVEVRRSGHAHPTGLAIRRVYLQFDFQQRLQASSTASAPAGLGAFDSSNSTSIGNLNQVNQTLSGGSSGSIGTTAQDSIGNQRAASAIKVRQPRRTPRSATRPTSWRRAR